MFNANFLVDSIVFFWLLRTSKFVLFWIYLWQLKSYHVGRFLDHFRTHKGKTLLINVWLLIKGLLLVGLALWPTFVWGLLAMYIAESLIFLLALVKRKVKKPVFTLKAVLLATLLLGTTLAFAVFFAKNFLALLLFDILVPVLVSLVVLLVEPVFVFMRYRTIKKATEKLNKYQSIKVIGITGSFGKTSTKEFLTTILSEQFKVLATPEHKNSEMGIAQTILEKLHKKYEIFIVEMGAYNKGGIKLLCDMVGPDIGVVTGVNQQHLSTFGSMENLLSAEGGGELADALARKGVLVVNGSNKYCLDLYKKFPGKKRLYSTQKEVIEGDLWTEDITVTENSISFITVSKKGVLQPFSVRVLGRQQVQNLLAAILVARELGMSFEKISEACKKIDQEQGGMTLTKGVHGIWVVDASYSSNPDGVVADLDYLSVFSGKKVIVMPCLIELGKDTKAVHRALGKKIATVCDLAIITTKDYFEDIKEGAMLEGMPAERILLSGNSRRLGKSIEMVAEITTFLKSGDVVLLEGRVPETVIKKLKHV